VIWKTAEKLHAAIFVHPWDMMGKERMPKYWLPWLVGMPAETSLAICSMIFGGVFERFPKIRVAFAHGGGSFPFTIGRIEHAFHVRPDLVAIDNKTEPKKYLAREDAENGNDVPARFYVDSLVHDPDALKMLVKMFGVERVALGSDYPFPLGEATPGKLIESIEDLSGKEKAQLLAGTAREFLGIKA
jgi:aminocarboxymuconate-semialdehyde decarboxylase